MESRNISMIMDFYELTMSNGYFSDNTIDHNQRVAFDVFYRNNPDNGGFAIFAGLQQIVDYILNMHFEKEDIEYLRSLNVFNSAFLDYLANFHFTGDIYAFKEGTIMYPNEPIITVVAPLIDAQLIETEILLQINHQSLIATKANRIVRAAKGRSISDFGARRAHNNDSALYGARACYIAGVDSTATILAGQKFSIPISGTMAHSYVMYYQDEFTAFKKYALTYPDNIVLLIDTYDVIKSGIVNTIRLQKEVLDPIGKKVKAVRLDSGDLAYLSKKIRKMLDEAGMNYCKIIASNSLDEYTITSLLNQDAQIDFFGVGERMITAKSDPVFGAVYKISAVEENGIFQPRIKISENVEKITNPCLKQVYRIFDEDKKAIADLLALKDEKVDLSKKYRYISADKPWKERYYENYTAEEMLLPVIKNGKLVSKLPSLTEIRDYVSYQLEHLIWKEEQRFENPHKHYMDMSVNLYNTKMELLHQKRGNNE